MATATKKAAKERQRAATVLTLSDGTRVLCLTVDGDMRGYRLTALGSDFGAAYRLDKADNGDGDTESYDVLLDGARSSCTCKGHTYRGKCKHVDALNKLHRVGKL